MKRLLFFSVWLLFVVKGIAQILPTERSIFNYRIIGFSNPAIKDGVPYTLEIARGFFNNNDSFSKAIVSTTECHQSRILAEVPDFGATYTWRVRLKTASKGKESIVLHHFSTSILKNADTAFFRLRVLKNADKYSDAYVFVDANKTLYAMDGKPVWFLPDNIDGLKNIEEITDLKVTPFGTITFIVNDWSIYEIDFSGKVLWRGPNNTITNKDAHYHHEFTRLENGHYMALATEPVYWVARANQPIDSGLYYFSDVPDFSKYNETFPFWLLIEYDAKGNTIKKWRFYDYFKESDLFYACPPGLKYSFDAHANSFYFDDKQKVIYVSLRNINRVIKLDYATGKLLNSYGELLDKVKKDTLRGLYKGQHSISLGANGNLNMYNNNIVDAGLPNVLELQQDKTSKDKLNKVWKYECNIDDLHTEKQITVTFTRGGSVTELPDRSLLVSMSTPYGKLFIVNRDKTIAWSAVVEMKDYFEKKWVMNPSYRVSFLRNKSSLGKLIWKSVVAK